MADDDPILVEQLDGGLYIIRLNRPAARNAVNRQLAQAMSDVLDRFEDDPEATVAILTGSGSTFCAGADLKAIVAGEAPVVEDRGFGGITQRASTKPLIAAVEGYAVAGGMEIALACDLIVAASNAMFGLPEVKRGLVAAAGGLLRLPRRIPYHVAMELAITGAMLPAERAAQLGLIARLAEPGTALDTAIALAGEIAGNGPLAVLTTKRILVEQWDWSAEEMWQRQGELCDPVFDSEDAHEGALAFAEKRPPQWRGR